jgi:hypothetical protein
VFTRQFRRGYSSMASAPSPLNRQAAAYTRYGKDAVFRTGVSYLCFCVWWRNACVDRTRTPVPARHGGEATSPTSRRFQRGRPRRNACPLFFPGIQSDKVMPLVATTRTAASIDFRDWFGGPPTTASGRLQPFIANGLDRTADSASGSAADTTYVARASG